MNVNLFGPFPTTMDRFKERYRKLCMENHPDHGGTVTAFTNVQETYEMLLQNVTNTNFFVLSEADKVAATICPICHGRGADLDIVNNVVIRRWTCGTCKGVGYMSHERYMVWRERLKEMKVNLRGITPRTRNDV